MTFQSNIPQSTDLISASQTDLLNNFTVLNTAWGINHVAFNDSNQGKHKYVTCPEQSSGPATSANEMSVYTKETGSISTLYVRRESSGTEIRLTGPSAGDPSSQASNFTTFLPGGFIIKAGQFTATSTTYTLTYTSASPALTAFPTTTACVMLTRINSTASTWRVSTANSTGFTVVTDTANGSFYFLALGY